MTSCTCQQHRCLLCHLHRADAPPGERHLCDQGLVTRKVLRPREMLFHQGAPVKMLYILKHGYVKLSASLPDGRTQGLQLGTPWNLIGIEALNDATYACSAEAATDVQVCAIRRDDLVALMRHNGELSLQLINLLNRELHRSLFHIRNIGVMDAVERVAAFLISIAPDPAPPELDIALPITRGDIGEILGLTVETVSRVLARLRKEGIVDAPSMGRHYRILDQRRLAQLGGQEPIAMALDCA